MKQIVTKQKTATKVGNKKEGSKQHQFHPTPKYFPIVPE